MKTNKKNAQGAKGAKTNGGATSKNKTENGSKGNGNVTAPQQKAKLIWIDPKTIIVDEKTNSRIIYDGIEELRDQIVENGLSNPLKVFYVNGKPHLREGFRRMRAINLALSKGVVIKLVPALADEKKLTEEEAIVENFINNDGRPYTMLDQSIVVKRLLGLKLTLTEISKKLGKAPGYIGNLIMLTKLPQKIINYIMDGKISANTVIKIIQSLKTTDEATLLAEVEAAIKEAAAAGKGTATPKHLKSKATKGESHGKFYKWCISILDGLPGIPANRAERVEVLDKVIFAYENGQSPQQFAESFFIDKAKLKEMKAAETKKGEQKPALEKKTAPAKKTAAKSAPKKAAKKASKKK